MLFAPFRWFSTLVVVSVVVKFPFADLPGRPNALEGITGTSSIEQFRVAAKFRAMTDIDTLDTIFFYLLLWLAIWGLCALGAAIVANERELRVALYFFITLLFLGPLGPGFALVAPHGRIEKSQLAAIPEGK